MHNALALEHYYRLRAQDVNPQDARNHVRQRFGVVINGDLPNPDEVVTPVTLDPARPSDFGSELTETIWGTSTGPVDGIRRAYET